MRTSWLLFPTLIGCANVTSPEDELDLGPVTQLKDWFTSAYVARTDDSAVLFDAGFREGRMERNLEDVGLTAADIDHVVLTHGHSDHVGALGLYPAATVWALPEEFDLIEEESGRRPDEALPTEGFFTVGSVDFRVFAVPGHTAGSAVFLVDDVLLLGDTALQSRDGELIEVAERRSADPEASAANLRALADQLESEGVTVSWLAPSHSAPIQGFEALAEF